MTVGGGCDSDRQSVVVVIVTLCSDFDRYRPCSTCSCDCRWGCDTVTVGCGCQVESDTVTAVSDDCE